MKGRKTEIENLPSAGSPLHPKYSQQPGLQQAYYARIPELIQVSYVGSRDPRIWPFLIAITKGVHSQEAGLGSRAGACACFTSLPGWSYLGTWVCWKSRSCAAFPDTPEYALDFYLKTDSKDTWKSHPSSSSGVPWAEAVALCYTFPAHLSQLARSTLTPICQTSSLCQTLSQILPWCHHAQQSPVKLGASLGLPTALLLAGPGANVHRACLCTLHIPSHWTAGTWITALGNRGNRLEYLI